MSVCVRVCVCVSERKRVCGGLQMLSKQGDAGGKKFSHERMHSFVAIKKLQADVSTL